MIVLVLLVLTVLRSVTCLDCDNPIDNQIACCNIQTFREKNKNNNCSFYQMQDKCSPREEWDKSEKSCQQFNFDERNQITVENGMIWCGGNLKNDWKQGASAYDKNGFFWYCPASYAGSPPAALKEATVLLEPSPGNITRPIRREWLDLTVKLTGGFPGAREKLFFQNGTTLKPNNLKGGTDLNHTYASSSSYEIDLRNKETLFTIVVYQPGLQNKTFHYRVTTVDKNTVNSQNDMRGQDKSSGCKSLCNAEQVLILCYIFHNSLHFQLSYNN